MPGNRKFCWKSNGKVLGMVETELMYFKGHYPVALVGMAGNDGGGGGDGRGGGGGGDGGWSQ